MERNDLIKKCLVIAIIFLFIGLAFAPSINANVDRNIPKSFSKTDKSKTVKIAVYEYKADGTIEKNVVRLSYEKLTELKAEIQMVENIAERLSLFKDYSLIPQHVTLEQLKVGMKEKPQRIEFITEIIDNNVRWLSNRRHINRNSNCEVSGKAFFGFKVLLGLSPITGLINRFNLYLGTFGSPLFPYLKSRDLLQLHYASVIGVETKNGAMPSFLVEAGYKARIILFGFVGYYITISPFIPKFLLTFWDAFLGFAEYIEVHWSDYVGP